MASRTLPAPRHLRVVSEAERPSAISRWTMSPRRTIAVLVGSTTILTIVGVVMVLSASYVFSYVEYGSSFLFFKRQAMYAVVGFGALLLTLAQQNRAESQTQRRLAWVLAGTGGLFIMNFALFLTEFGERRMMHSPKFYEVVSLAFPFALTAMARAIKLRWAATAAAAFYTAVTLILMWTLQLFPATPKLGPIYQHVTHMITLSFPLLIIVPTFCIDLVIQRLDDKLATFQLALVTGVVFVAAFVAAQWPFASFLMYNPIAVGPLFNAENFVYWMSPTYAALSRRFDTPAPGSWPLLAHVAIAIGLATISSLEGLRLGRWMRRVRR